MLRHLRLRFTPWPCTHKLCGPLQVAAHGEQAAAEMAPGSPWHTTAAHEHLLPPLGAVPRSLHPLSEATSNVLATLVSGNLPNTHKSQGPSGDAAHLGSQAWSQEVPGLGPSAPGQPSRAKAILEVPHSPSTPGSSLVPSSAGSATLIIGPLLPRANLARVQGPYKIDLVLNRDRFHSLFQREPGSEGLERK